jgi:glycine betaine catabolism B
MGGTYLTTVIAVHQKTPQVQTLHFAKPSGFSYTAGQYFFLSFLSNGQPFKKPLSFSSAPHEPNLSFTKRISTSVFSQTIAQLKVGDTLTIEGPFGNFILPEKPAQLVFIAGGIGITPFRSMLLENTWTKQHNITLLYGSTAATEIIFKTELEQFQVHQQIGGTITAEFINKHIPDQVQKLFYICGSPAMVTAMCNILQNELDIPNTQIKLEKLAGY